MAISATKTPLERFLGLFAEVKPGEAGTALLLTLNIFLILISYLIMKPVREALILSETGPEFKAYMAAGMTFLLLFTVPLYAKLVSRFSRQSLINGVTFFFAACLVVFWLLARMKVPLGVTFFIWIGIFNVVVIAQFWSFANDIYTEEQGKRLFAIIAFGASAGAVFGPQIAKAFVRAIGPYGLLLTAGGILLLSLFFTNIVNARERARERRPEEKAESKEEPIKKGGAYKLVFGSRYLLAVALLILFLNWVNTTGGYILDRVVSEKAVEAVAAQPGLDEKVFYTEFYGGFYGVVNVAGLLIQLFLVSRILKYFGVRVALMILPVIALAGYMCIAFFPVLSLIRWTKTAENATDYSLQNTLRGILFLPTTREEKYKAKQAIDTIFVRIGDALSGLLVFVGTHLAFQTKHFAMVNLSFVVVWLGLAAFVGKEYLKLAKKRSEERSEEACA
ncbi:MAG: Npt1/Npt2 family nucleotide transporter [Candidatus Krumholzibacteria bacterium]